MSLTRLTLSSFTVFEDVALDFDPGINVFIGPNGTGKTHALKIMYSVLRSLERSLRWLPLRTATTMSLGAGMSLPGLTVRRIGPAT